MPRDDMDQVRRDTVGLHHQVQWDSHRSGDRGLEATVVDDPRRAVDWVLHLFSEQRHVVVPYLPFLYPGRLCRGWTPAAGSVPLWVYLSVYRRLFDADRDDLAARLDSCGPDMAPMWPRRFR